MQIPQCPECRRLVVLANRPAVRLSTAAATVFLAGPDATPAERLLAAALGFSAGVFLDKTLAHHCPDCNAVLQVVADLAA